MKITAHFFASAREAVGVRQLQLDLTDGATAADLVQQLVSDYPRLAGCTAALRVAVNEAYTDLDTVLHQNDEVALIPPVSGGSPMQFIVTEESLEPRKLEALLESPANGAIVTFQGVVRNHSRGKTVSYLEYDAYAPMATKVMAQIAEEAKQRWPITDLGIWHRIGHLEIGQASLLVVVTAAHRKECFEACHWTVDRIKEDVPVWKKEVWADGESWVEGDVLVATGHHHDDDH